MNSQGLGASLFSRLALRIVIATIVSLAPGTLLLAALNWNPRADIPVRTGNHAGGTINDIIYIAGGGFFGTALQGSSSRVWKYVPADDPGGVPWINLPALPLMVISGTPTAKRTYSAGAVALKEDPPGTFEERFYVIGGQDLDDIFAGILQHRSIVEYSPSLNSWRVIPTLFNTISLSAIEAATVNNKIYVIGGFDDIQSNYEVRVWVYDPVDDSINDTGWDLADPCGRARGAVAVHGTNIYYFAERAAHFH